MEPITMAALLAGAGGLAAGAGSFFGGKRSAPPQSNVDWNNVPYLTQTTTGEPLTKLVLDRMKGQGLGFGDEFVSRYTNPYISQYKSAFQEDTLPAMEAAASSRGLGRSTIATRDIGKATAQNERDINQLVADAYMKNLVQGKADLSEAGNWGMGLAQGDYNTELARATGQAQQQQYNISNQIPYQQYQSQRLPTAIGTGLSTAGSLLGANIFGNQQSSPTSGSLGKSWDTISPEMLATQSQYLSTADIEKQLRDLGVL